MSEPFIGEIRIFPYQFAPRGWALCNGQSLPIAQNYALFSVIGNTYGGDGVSSFALPDLRGRAPMHPGQGPGLSSYYLGQKGGAESVQLSVAELPEHSHRMRDRDMDLGEVSVPAPNCSLAKSANAKIYAAPGSLTPMSAASLSEEGGGQAHNNMQPYLTCQFCIALDGVYPKLAQ
jgi:microcystin-dependent protein